MYVQSLSHYQSTLNGKGLNNIIMLSKLYNIVWYYLDHST